MAGRLSVVPTPIGNLADVTLRGLETLRAADVIACEDTRRTRALLSAHGIPAPRLVVCDERQEARRAPELVALAAGGAHVVLVSDAGMPGIADPGRTLVARALEAGIPLTVLPGPSAVEPALVASGLAREGYAFRGWVPRRASDRRRFLDEAGRAGLPVVAFESPNRLRATLEDLGTLEPPRTVAVARELSKLHEQVVRGTAARGARGAAGAGARGDRAGLRAARRGRRRGHAAGGCPGRRRRSSSRPACRAARRRRWSPA